MNLGAIREAIAAKLTANVQRAIDKKIDVKAYQGIGQGVVVAVRPNTPYVVHWDPDDSDVTFGSNGMSVINFTIEVRVPPSEGSPESPQIVVDDLLSIGTEADSSIFDGLMKAPRTLGGLCEEMRITHADAIYDDKGAAARGYLKVFARKGGAEV